VTREQKQLSNDVADEVANWSPIFDDLEVTRLRIAQELKTVALSDISDYIKVSPDGSVTMLDLDTIPGGASKAIKSIKQTVKHYIYQDDPVTEVRTEFALWDKQDALKQIIELRGDKPAEKIKGRLDINWHLDTEGGDSDLDLSEE
jgi:hypothetical protein